MSSAGPPTIFSRSRRMLRAKRAEHRQKSPDAATFLLDEIADDIADRLQFMRFEPQKSLVIGDPSGSVEKMLAARGSQITARQVGELDEEQPLEEEAST